jgi:hypothetical protein
MQFTLITPKGKIYTFYLEAVALCFQQAYGGTLVNTSVLQTETA